MQARVLITIFMLLIISGSCSSDKKQNEDPAKHDSAIPSPNSAESIILVPAKPDKETAETIVAGYYSQLNRQAGFNKYKGLGLNITSVNPTPDSLVYLIGSETTGRVRKANDQDTSSSYFSEKIRLKARFQNGNWLSELIP